MIQCFIYSQIRFLALLVWTPRALLEHGWVAAFKRFFILVLSIPLFWCLQILHWFGMLLDTCFFPDWKMTKVNAPVFITGIPRSGTTFLQRTLAQDNRFTSTPTWELLFAPSISEKVFWTTIGRFLKPLRTFLSRQKFCPTLHCSQPAPRWIHDDVPTPWVVVRVVNHQSKLS